MEQTAQNRLINTFSIINSISSLCDGPEKLNHTSTANLLQRISLCQRNDEDHEDKRSEMVFLEFHLMASSVDR